MIIENEASFSEQMWLKYRACAQKLSARNSEADPADPAETQHPVQNRPWVPHAGGQDYGSLHKLPQIKGILDIAKQIEH